MTAIHFVDFEISREKGDFLKTTMWHLGLNRGSIIFRGVKLELRVRLGSRVKLGFVIFNFVLLLKKPNCS